MIARVRTYLSFVRFSHSVFALPFALTGALLASRQHTLTWSRVGWIVAAMVAARRAAMGEIPRGAMSTGEATVFLVISSAAFVFASWKLNALCAILSPVALAIV